MRETGPERLDSEAVHLPESGTGDERQHFIFYQDDGGLRATDEANLPMDTIYYLGVIDICTPYTTLKRAVHIWKSMHADRVCVYIAFFPDLSVSDSTLAPFSTRSALWNLASTLSASSLSSRQSCVTGKAVSASNPSEGNPPSVDPLPRRLFRVSGSCSWTLIFGILSQRRTSIPLPILFYRRRPHGINSVNTSFPLSSLHHLIMLVSFLSARACLLCLSLSLLLGLSLSLVVSIPPPRRPFISVGTHAPFTSLSIFSPPLLHRVDYH